MIEKYIKIPNIVLENANLSASSKLLYGILLSLNSNKEYSYANNTYLATILNISNRTISTLLATLKEERLIKIKYSKNKRFICIV